MPLHVSLLDYSLNGLHLMARVDNTNWANKKITSGGVSRTLGDWFNGTANTINAIHEGVVLDGVTDCTAALVSAFTKGMTTGKKVIIPGSGICSVTYIDITLTGNLQVELDNGVTIKGVNTLAEFTANGSQTVFTVTGTWT